MILSGWGNYPRRWSDYREIFKLKDLFSIKEFVVRGEGRSYGDASVGKTTIKLKHRNFFLSFNNSTIEVESNVLISELLEFLIKRKKFLPVVPGTKYITIGGAISSDIHGKNHHKAGSICNYVKKIKILLPNGEIRNISKEDKLFRGICGGMGLIGIILSAEIEVIDIPSPFIYQKTTPLQSLDEVFNAFEIYHNWDFSVAWYDFFSSKSLFIAGTFTNSEKNMKEIKAKKLPNFLKLIPLLNNFTIKLYNVFYYIKSLFKKEGVIDFNSFFFPLDSLLNWNILYGDKGFLQYQFVTPYIDFVKEIFTYLQKKKVFPYLVVIKKMGKENKNFLSFPKEGITVALDFPVNIDTLKILDELDQELIKAKGRIYLAKDARMSKKVFLNMDYKINEFVKLKEEIDPQNTLMSFLWRRIYYGK